MGRQKGYIFSAESKEKISRANKGRKLGWHFKPYRKKCVRCQKSFMGVTNRHKYCKSCSKQEVLERAKRYRENSKERTKIANYTYKYFRAIILKRDKVCQNCGSNKNLHLHHKEYSQKNKKELREEDMKKIILLCAKCHKRIHIK